MNFTPEQELFILKQQMAAQQSAAPAAPSGAVTANGIVKYQTIIIFIITSLVAVGGWLVINSVNGATKMTNIERDIEDFKKYKESISEVRTAQSKVGADVLLLQNTVKSIEDWQKKTGDRLDEMSKTLSGLPQQFSNLSTDIRNIRMGGR